MMRYLARERKMLANNNPFDKTELNTIKLAKEDQDFFNKKTNLDLKEYEQIIVDHALEKNKLKKQAGIIFDMKKVSKVQ